MKTLSDLLNTLPQIGSVEWIGLRPARDQAIISVNAVEALKESGLEGDRFAGRENNPRQVTLIQQEHLAVIAACLGQQQIEAQTLRRNIVVSGINLLALKGTFFRIGEATLEHTGLCHPCSKMERLLGAGGYNAMRGHGGITARIVDSGRISTSDAVFYTRSSTDQ